MGLEGVGIANVVANREEVVGWGEAKKIRSVITYDDGSSWRALKAPDVKYNGDDWECDVSDTVSWPFSTRFLAHQLIGGIRRSALCTYTQ